MFCSKILTPSQIHPELSYRNRNSKKQHKDLFNNIDIKLNRVKKSNPLDSVCFEPLFARMGILRMKKCVKDYI